MSFILKNFSKCLRTPIRAAIQTRTLAGKSRKCPGEEKSDLGKLKANQKLFQKDDGVPVFLKKGAQDKILFQVLLVLIGIASVMEVKLLVELAMK